WKDPVSGSLTDASKWDPAGVPAVDDTLVFDATGAAYTVNLGPSRTVGAIHIESADATVHVNGSSPNGHTTITATGGVTVSAGRLLLQSSNSSYQSRLSLGSGTL